MSSNQKAHLLQFLEDTFGTRLVTKKDPNFDRFLPDRCTLGDVTIPEKAVMIFLNKSLKTQGQSEEELEDRGFLMERDYYTTKWHDTDKAEDLLSQNLKQVLEAETYPQFLLFSQFNLTFQRRLDKVVLSIFNKKNRDIRKLNGTLMQKNRLLKFFKSNCDCSWNFVEFDYVCDLQIMLNMLIGLNYPYLLTIKRFMVTDRSKTVNATSQAAHHVVKGNTMLIINFREDLGVPFKQGEYSVEFYFGEEEFCMGGRVTGLYNEKTKLLINFQTLRTLNN